MQQHERVVDESMPTREQLSSLAAIGMSSAVQRDKLRHLKRRPDGGRIVEPSHYVFDELALIGNSELLPEEPVQIRHLMAMRVGTRREEGNLKTWSLKFYDTYWTEHAANQWTGERTLYRFEWNRYATLLADRAFRLVGFERPEENLEYDLDHFYIPDDMPDIWHAERQMGRVTGHECDRMIQSAQSYFSAVQSQHELTKR
jgi:hypothetical protein